MNTAFGYFLFSFFIFLKFHYSLAVLFATILAVIFNFKSIGKLVFKINNNSLIFRFFAVYGVTYLLNVALLPLVADSFHLDMYLAGASLLLPMAAISFTLHRLFVFKQTGKAIRNVAN